MVALVTLLAAAAMASGGPPPATGRLVEGLRCESDPSQTYTLYLPSGYTSSRRWPALLVLDLPPPLVAYDEPGTDAEEGREDAAQEDQARDGDQPVPERGDGRQDLVLRLEGILLGDGQRECSILFSRDAPRRDPCDEERIGDAIQRRAIRRPPDRQNDLAGGVGHAAYAFRDSHLARHQRALGPREARQDADRQLVTFREDDRAHRQYLCSR